MLSFYPREQSPVSRCGGLLRSASETNGLLSWGQTAGQEAQVVQLPHTWELGMEIRVDDASTPSCSSAIINHCVHHFMNELTVSGGAGDDHYHPIIL